MFPLGGDDRRFVAGAELWLSPTPSGGPGLDPTRIETSRTHKGRRLLKLDGIADRSQAERYAGLYLVIPREAAEAAREEGEHFLYALVGREVTADGRRLGRVADVLETGGKPLLEIELAGGERRLLPFVGEFVRAIDEESISVAPPDGWEDL